MAQELQDAAMRQAFEDRYQRDWNDPSGDEMKATWAAAWAAARAITDPLLQEALEHITPKPWDDSTMLHARISRALGLEVEYPDQLGHDQT